jgi:hypothetical protein
MFYIDCGGHIVGVWDFHPHDSWIAERTGLFFLRYPRMAANVIAHIIVKRQFPSVDERLPYVSEHEVRLAYKNRRRFSIVLQRKSEIKEWMSPLVRSQFKGAYLRPVLDANPRTRVGIHLQPRNVGGAGLGGRLPRHLGEGFIELRLAIGELLLAHQSSLSLSFLREKNSFIRSFYSILRCTSLPKAQTQPQQPESDQPDLGPKDTFLKRVLFISVGLVGYAIFSFLGVWVLQGGSQNWDTRFQVIKGVLFFIVIALLGQFSVFLMLRGFWGR